MASYMDITDEPAAAIWIAPRTSVLYTYASTPRAPLRFDSGALRGHKETMKQHTHARPAVARQAPNQIRTAIAAKRTTAWKPEPTAISRAEMREIIIQMIG